MLVDSIFSVKLEELSLFSLVDEFTLFSKLLSEEGLSRLSLDFSILEESLFEIFLLSSIFFSELSSLL